MQRLVMIIKARDEELKSIKENMLQWKQETIDELVIQFETQLNEELER